MLDRLPAAVLAEISNSSSIRVHSFPYAECPVVSRPSRGRSSCRCASFNRRLRTARTILACCKCSTPVSCPRTGRGSGFTTRRVWWYAARGYGTFGKRRGVAFKFSGATDNTWCILTCVCNKNARSGPVYYLLLEPAYAHRPREGVALEAVPRATRHGGHTHSW